MNGYLNFKTVLQITQVFQSSHLSFRDLNKCLKIFRTPKNECKNSKKVVLRPNMATLGANLPQFIWFITSNKKSKYLNTRNTRITRKYPTENKIPENTRLNISTLIPGPNPPDTRLFFQYPTRTRPILKKPYPLGPAHGWTIGHEYFPIMMKPACELALLIEGCIFILAQL